MLRSARATNEQQIHVRHMRSHLARANINIIIFRGTRQRSRMFFEDMLRYALLCSSALGMPNTANGHNFLTQVHFIPIPKRFSLLFFFVFFLFFFTSLSIYTKRYTNRSPICDGWVRGIRRIHLFDVNGNNPPALFIVNIQYTIYICTVSRTSLTERVKSSRVHYLLCCALSPWLKESK